MATQETRTESPSAADLLQESEAVICGNCGNIYRIERLKEGEDYNDFGQRYCPFCGLLTDEWRPLKKKHLNRALTDKINL